MYAIQPIFKERIWGGRRLEALFQFELPEGQIGECWTASARASGRTHFLDGPDQGKTLVELWRTKRTELFGDYLLDAFPLHVKLLDSSAYLSVQVHPNDEEARRLEGEPYGKNECWYILEAAPEVEIILGHNLQSRDALLRCAQEKDWETSLRHQKVKPGEFYYIPSGTIHALGPGVVLLEIQQMSDRTYRLYDYDRLGDDGKPRELHVEKAIAVTTIPDEPWTNQPETIVKEGGVMTKLLQVSSFTVIRHEVTGTYALHDHPVFRLLTVIDGKGEARQGNRVIPLQKGKQFFVPRRAGDYEITGSVTFVTSEVFLD